MMSEHGLFCVADITVKCKNRRHRLMILPFPVLFLSFISVL